MSNEATKIKLEAERTARLAPAWRERMEDAVCALVNSPEFMFVP